LAIRWGFRAVHQANGNQFFVSGLGEFVFDVFD
jgi:hypothetical protein